MAAPWEQTWHPTLSENNEDKSQEMPFDISFEKLFLLKWGLLLALIGGIMVYDILTWYWHFPHQNLFLTFSYSCSSAVSKQRYTWYSS